MGDLDLGLLVHVPTPRLQLRLVQERPKKLRLIGPSDAGEESASTTRREHLVTAVPLYDDPSSA